MILEIKPYHRNAFDNKAFLIKGADPYVWLIELKSLGIDIESVQTFPIGGKEVNSTWGCIIISNQVITKDSIGRFEMCQKVNDFIYIPEMSTLSPMLTIEDSEKLFGTEKHLYHPDTGLVSLGAPIDWSSLLLDIKQDSSVIIEPVPSIFIPTQIIGFHIQPVPKEEILKDLETPVKPEKIENKPLSFSEKAKLKAYKTLLGKGGSKIGNGSEGVGAGGLFGGFLGALASGIGSMVPGMEGWTESMTNDMEELERRNRNELEKLMDLMKENPEEALKYAIPLDENGSSRGGIDGAFNMTRRWGDFSLFGSGNQLGSNGPGVNLNSQFVELMEQYNKSAEDLIKEKKFEKAAFIYMKLLKNYTKAAQTMEQGKFYQEAAAIYLKYGKDKLKAAECYEKGLYYSEAIDLYKELKKYEKAGDLLLTTNDKEGAFEQYTLLANELESKHKYVKASLVYKNKMEDRTSGQTMLLKGWKNQKDEFNCLNNYFNNIEEPEEKLAAIKEVNQGSVNSTNDRTFLKVISYEFKRQTEISKDIKDIAYTIISKKSIANPDIVNELVGFNLDNEISKDSSRYRIGEKLRKESLGKITNMLRAK